MTNRKERRKKKEKKKERKKECISFHNYYEKHLFVSNILSYQIILIIIVKINYLFSKYFNLDFVIIKLNNY